MLLIKYVVNQYFWIPQLLYNYIFVSQPKIFGFISPNH